MLILGTAECAAQHLAQLVVLDKMLHFIRRRLLVFPLFLEIHLAFVITLHFGAATGLLGRGPSGIDAGFLLEHRPCVSSGLGSN